MGLRPHKSFTHSDRKVEGDVIKPNTNVYVFQPCCTKFHLRWEGPFAVSREENSSYIVKITLNWKEDKKSYIYCVVYGVTLTHQFYITSMSVAER